MLKLLTALAVVLIVGGFMNMNDAYGAEDKYGGALAVFSGCILFAICFVAWIFSS